MIEEIKEFLENKNFIRLYNDADFEKTIKFYKIYNMKNQFIGNAKIEEIEKHYKKKDGNIWVKY